LKTAVSEDGSAPWLDEVDALVIATSPAAHFPLAKRALDLGKHILVEKPFTMNPLEAAELLDLSAKVGRVCAVSHNFLFSHSMRRLEQLIQNGDLGQITGIEGVQMSNPQRRLPVWYNNLPLGLFYDESPHLLYLARHFAGGKPRLAAVQMIPAPGNAATPYSLSLAYQGTSFPMRISMLFHASLSEWHFIIMGSKKIAIADIFRDILIVARNDQGHKASDILNTSLSVFSSHFLGTISSGVRMLSRQLYYGTETIYDRFIDSILNKTIPAGIHAGDGLDVVQMQHDILESCLRQV
jgi:predicted dehydrogenase